MSTAEVIAHAVLLFVCASGMVAWVFTGLYLCERAWTRAVCFVCAVAAFVAAFDHFFALAGAA